MVDFIHRKKGEPFFFYVPHPQPHVPPFFSDDFKGKSGKGLYGDVMMELDWSVGQINQAMKDSGVDDNTILVFSPDNGPWTSYSHHAGVTPFREAKGTSFDGGVRSACIALPVACQLPASYLQAKKDLGRLLKLRATLL